MPKPNVVMSEPVKPPVLVDVGCLGMYIAAGTKNVRLTRKGVCTDTPGSIADRGGYIDFDADRCGPTRIGLNRVIGRSLQAGDRLHFDDENETVYIMVDGPIGPERLARLPEGKEMELVFSNYLGEDVATRCTYRTFSGVPYLLNKHRHPLRPTASSAPRLRLDGRLYALEL